jgi:hypothetical protein
MDETKSAQLKALRELPVALREIVKGLNDAQLDTPYRTGGWTVRQVVHHLADSHMHAYIRMRLIVAEDHPTIKPYDQDAWAATPDVRTGSPESSLVLLTGLHARWCAFLDHLPDTAWGRTALHPERGEVTLGSMLATYAGHGVKHVGHIRSLREARQW